MNKRFQALSILTMIILLLTACSRWTVQTQEPRQTAPKTITYRALLGKSVSDKVVADFIVSNNCASMGHSRVCREVGMALWTDADQIIETVDMYSGNGDGFRRYRGELPFELTFYDPMWLVEEKLSDLNADDTIQAVSRNGAPDEGSSPDHIHYWAVYKQLGLTVIYDSGAADPDAYIYAVLISQ